MGRTFGVNLRSTKVCTEIPAPRPGSGFLLTWAKDFGCRPLSLSLLDLQRGGVGLSDLGESSSEIRLLEPYGGAYLPLQSTPP